MVEQIARHAHRRSRRDEPVLPSFAIVEDYCFVWCNALYAGARAVAKAEGFLDAGCEVGEVFEGY